MSINFDDLIKKPSIKRPIEEYILPAPLDEPTPTPTTTKSEEFRSLTPEETLFDEAARVDELISIIISTAENITLPVPSVEQDILGVSVSTKDYINALDNNDPISRRKKDFFEKNLLPKTSCGFNLVAWPILALPDLFNIRDRLVSTMNVYTGNTASSMGLASEINLYDTGPSGSAKWMEFSKKSGLSDVATKLAQYSQDLRIRVAGAVFTMDTDIRSSLFTCLFEPLVNSTAEQLTKSINDTRKQLNTMVEVIETMRNALCVAQIIRMMEYQDYREAFLALVKTLVMEELLQTLNILLYRSRALMIEPIMGLFESGFPGHEVGLAECLKDEIAETVGSAILQACYTLQSYYNNLTSDLIRSSNSEYLTSAKKIQTLHEQSAIGRWIRHLDEAILFIKYYLNRTELFGQLTSAGREFINQALPPENSKLYKTLREHPEYSDYYDNSTTGFRTTA